MWKAEEGWQEGGRHYAGMKMPWWAKYAELSQSVFSETSSRKV